MSTSSPDFTHLHVHSYYSLMDGLNSPEELAQAAKDMGQDSLAITDHGTLSSHRGMQEAAVKVGIKPILGCEMYLSPTDRFDKRDVKKREDNTQLYNHLIVLAKDAKGLSNLQKLSELAWSEGYYYKPRIDRDILEEYREGLIVLSGCLNGVIAKAIARDDDAVSHDWIKYFQENFGDDFYMELQPDNPFEINSGLLRLADKFGVKPVVTADCHFARPEDRAAEEAMLILSTSPKRADGQNYESTKKIADVFERLNALYPNRPISFEKLDLFIRGRGDMYSTLEKQGLARQDMFDSTLEISEKIGSYEYPEALDLLPKPRSEDPALLLRKRVYAGLKAKGLDTDPVYTERAEEELKVIIDKNFPTYFIIESNMIEWAKKQDILVGPGRGSAAGSLICYALGITTVDPIKYGLLFFRFINPERDDYPDVDTDFEDKRRVEVKNYLKRQYKHVANISTYSYFKGKNVIRDASRVFGVPLADVNKALKNVDAPTDNVDYFSIWEKTDQARDFMKKYPEIVPMAKKLQGRIRSAGMHASGVIVSKEPIERYCSIESRVDPKDKVSGRIAVITADMEQAADIGFIKLDVLGLKTLTVIADAKRIIKDRHGVDIDLEALPLDDQKVYDELSAGYTVGVFQAEAAPYTKLLKDMKVSNFMDLAASNALVRPGAANTVGKVYIARKRGEEVVKYDHPMMQEFTSNSYGVIIYQEQVMQACVHLGGMTWGEADKVRKIIGKKKDVKEFDKFKDKFISGASQHVAKQVAEKLWNDFEAHAGYSFNLSHAVAYSMLSYWSAWIKLNYPIEYMYALLKNEEDKDKRTEYLIESKRLGIPVLLPHINKSDVDFTIEGDSIRFGLSNVKFISDATAMPIMNRRPFTSWKHVMEVTDEKGSGVNSRAISALDKVGGTTFADRPKRGDESDYYYEYLNIPKFGTHPFPQHTLDLIIPLEEYEEKGVFVVKGMVKKIKKGKGWSRIEIVDESGTAGIFHNEDTQILSGQMYFFLVANNRIARYITADEIWEAIEKPKDDGFINYLITEELYTTAGSYYVVCFDRRKTKAGKWMGTLVLANEHKEMRTILVFPQAFSKAYGKAREGATIFATFKRLDDGGLCLNEIE